MLCMERINVSFPKGLAKRAHKLELNVSRTCADAVLSEVVKREQLKERKSGYCKDVNTCEKVE
jgi:post-segregation antitoxin (ccd killing protein)